MRALPIIERGLLVLACIAVLGPLVFLALWHCRLMAMQRSIATLTPITGLIASTGGADETTDPDLLRDFQRWKSAADGSAAFACESWHDAITDWCRYEDDDVEFLGEIMAIRSTCDRHLHTLDDLLARGFRLRIRSNDEVEYWHGRGVQFERAATAWQLIARLDRDPDTAFAHQSTLLDAIIPDGPEALMVCERIADIRADTCLEAAWAGLLSDALRQRWEATANADLHRMAVALGGERCHGVDPGFCQRFAVFPIEDWRDAKGDWGDRKEAISSWWSLPEQLELRNEGYRQDVDAILGHTSPRWAPPMLHSSPCGGPDPRLHDLSLLADGWSRLYRRHLQMVAADVLAISDRLHALPSDAQQLEAAGLDTSICPHGVLAATPDFPRLKYALVEPTSFTVQIDGNVNIPWPVGDYDTFSLPLEMRMLSLSRRVAIASASRPAPVP